MAKSKLKQKAMSMRKSGSSIREIVKKLKISSSTASIWCRNVKLNPRQIDELERRYHDPFYGKRYENIVRQKEKRLANINTLKEEGIKEIGRLNDREIFIIGVAIYWGEGFKKDSRLGFANSDPHMVKIFLKWLINICLVPKEDIRLRVGLNISHKNRIKEVEEYWANITNIPLAQFQKPFFQKFIWKKQFPNPSEYFGVLRIRANKQLPLFRKINGWIEGIKLNSR